MNIEDYIIEIPLVEVFYKGVSQGFHNELTVQNILVKIKKKEVKNHFEFIFKDKKHIIKQEDGNVWVSPNFEKGFWDISYKLALNLMD